MPSIPHALEMRDLKYGAKPEAERDRVAALLLAADRRAESLLLYEGRPGHAAVLAERDRAAREGNAFLLLLIERMGAPVGPEHLRLAAQAAEAAGRWMEALQLWKRLADPEGLARVNERVPPSLRVEEAAGT
jgi:hypothetical protein